MAHIAEKSRFAPEILPPEYVESLRRAITSALSHVGRKLEEARESEQAVFYEGEGNARHMGGELVWNSGALESLSQWTGRVRHLAWAEERLASWLHDLEPSSASV